ncbi:hypothetical protein [Allofustis seminis]|uniref:hypothetical protein n=1 Tax=Allofustis seminis TaxID=166939 RepID=UPI00035E1A26|nr:hypothetical protein [Allofustis seminis]
MVSRQIRFTLRISNELNKKIEQISEEKQLSKNRVVIEACKRLVDEWNKSHGKNE